MSGTVDSMWMHPKTLATIYYNNYSEEFIWPLSEIREDISNKNLFIFFVVFGVYKLGGCYMYI